MRIPILKDRAALLAAARSFFASRGIVEVDCPILSPYASVDAHIDLIRAGTQYLHSSPEYGMKRLLCEGMGDIFQLSHVFRDGEHSAKHRPEFMMAEWYRVGMTFPELIEETLEFCRLFLGPVSSAQISYREAFKKYLGIDYFHLTTPELEEIVHKSGIPIYPEALQEGKDGLLNLLLGIIIEPQLGVGGFTVLTHYPASQAALAKTTLIDGEQVAERFEVYYEGVELANGYHELADPIDQRQRLIDANEMRKKNGKETLPIDEEFLKALEKGLPDCCGVAVGFDRLMMLRHQTNQIGHVIIT